MAHARLENPKICITRKLPASVEARFRAFFPDILLNEEDIPFSSEKLSHALQSVDILIPTVTDKLTKPLLETATVKLIANYGAGYDNIDIETALKKGIVVSNTPNVLTEDTADLTLALMLSVPRRLKEGIEVIQQEKWQGWSPTFMMGQRLKGLKLGIIGMGRIGVAVAERAKAFGLEIHYHNRSRVMAEIEDKIGAVFWADLNDMLPEIDILSIHCPRTPATYHLLSRQRLRKMKPTSIIINTARGDVIDEGVLAEALEEGWIAGAGLDVFEQEPNIHPKLKASKALLLPHLGSATEQSRFDMGERVLLNVKTFIDGHMPPDRIVSAM